MQSIAAYAEEQPLANSDPLDSLGQAFRSLFGPSEPASDDQPTSPSDLHSRTAELQRRYGSLVEPAPMDRRTSQLQHPSEWGDFSRQDLEDDLRHSLHLQPRAFPELIPQHREGDRFSNELIDRANRLAANIAAATHGGTVYITSGLRDPRTQAEAMYNNYGPGEPTYRNRAAAADIRAAYNDGKARGLARDQIISNMEAVIQRQLAGGTAISRHLTSKALDIRRDTDPAVIAAIRSNPLVQSIQEEDDHWHVQFN
jgi:hypothetical protein